LRSKILSILSKQTLRFYNPQITPIFQINQHKKIRCFLNPQISQNPQITQNKIHKKNPVNPVKKNPLFLESTDYTDGNNPQITQISQMKTAQKESCESCQKNPLFFESTDYTDFTDENSTKRIL